MKRLSPAFLFVLFLFLVVFAAGCGNDERGKNGDSSENRLSKFEKPAASPPVILNWIGHWKGEDRREELVLDIKREFEFTHPGVSVNLVFNRDIEGPDPDYKKRTAREIVRMIRSGRIDWDVVFVDVAIYDLVAEMLGDPDWIFEHLVDFSEVPGFLETQKDFIVQDPRYRGKIGGMLTGPFIENYMMTPWFNSKVAALTGIEVRERGMTLEEFIEAAEKLHRYNSANGTNIAFIKLSSWNRIDIFFESLFKSLFDDFAEAVTPEFNEAKGKAFRTVLEAFERIAAYQPILEEGWPELTTTEFLRELVLEDDALFVMGGSFMYSQFRGVDKKLSKKMRPLEMPVLGKPNGLIGDYSPIFAVMKDGSHRDLAVELVMSWATAKNAEKWVRYTKNLTGTKGNLSEAVSREIDYSDDVYEKFVRDMESKYTGVPMMYMRTPTYVFGEKSPVSVHELREKLAAILEGKLSADEYYDDVMERLALTIKN